MRGVANERATRDQKLICTAERSVDTLPLNALATQAIDIGDLESGKPTTGPVATPRQGGYVSLHSEKSPFKRLGSWLRGKGA